ncbi:hypothetical protein AVEN_174284-1, partial [Araneus ventricosus]
FALNRARLEDTSVEKNIIDEPSTRAMDEKFEMPLAMMKEIKGGHEEMIAGQEEMRSLQERLVQEMRSGEEEIKN